MKLKKDMIVLVHENYDKWPNVTPVQHFYSGFDQSNLVSSIHDSKYLPKIRFSNVYFFENEHLKRYICLKR